MVWAAGPSRAGVLMCESYTSSINENYFAIDYRLTGSTGTLSYVQARVIDICWDLIIGQGGRAIQAYFLVRVASNALTVLMEQSTLPYHFYTSTTFEGPSFTSIKSSIKVLTDSKAWRVRLVSLWLLWSTIHVIGFPTLWSLQPAM